VLTARIEGAAPMFIWRLFPASLSLTDYVFPPSTDLLTVSYAAFGYATDITFRRVQLIDNSASAPGGALSIRNGALSLEGAVVQDNRAPELGGALFVQGTTSVDCSDSVFENNFASAAGMDVYSVADGGFALHNSTVHLGSTGTSGLELPKTGVLNFTRGTLWQCPAGHSLVSNAVRYSITSTVSAPDDVESSTRVMVSSLSVSCRACAASLYSLSPGTAVNGQVQNYTCSKPQSVSRTQPTRTSLFNVCHVVRM
jgi:hypothetical protein